MKQPQTSENRPNKQHRDPRIKGAKDSIRMLLE
jgi:hypothetical protein